VAHLKKPRVTSWWLAGRRVPAGTPGAAKRTRLARKWYAYGVPGCRRPVPLAADRRAAERLLAGLLSGGERAAAGLPDPRAADLPLTPDLLDRFAEAVRLGTAPGAGRRRVRPGPAQVAQVKARLRRAFDGCGWTRPADLDAQAASGWLAARVAMPRKGRHHGLSAQTADDTLLQLRRFARWLAGPARAGTDPRLFDALPGFDAKANRVHDRRAATPAELAALLAAAAAGPFHRGLTGPRRRLLYLTALGTGLRLEELARVAPANLRLDLDPPEVRLDPKTKGRRAVRQPLPAGVAAELAPLLADTPAGGRVWPGKWNQTAAAMLRRDLAAAGVAYWLDDGTGPKALDFHALRHTYVTSLADAGASVKEAQVLARHTDPRLTLGVYTHASRAGLAAAVNRIDPSAPPSPLAALTRAELEGAVGGLLLVLGGLLGRR
jgi:integrase